MISRGELKGQILRILQKDSSYSGFYTDAKVNDAIQDCIDFISVDMAMGGEGWLRKIVHLDTTSGVNIVDLPPQVAVIDEVRYKVGNRFLPLTYDDATHAAQFDNDAGVNQFPSRYRIVDQKIYFNPAPAEGGTGYLQIEYASFPDSLKSDNQVINRQFNAAMTNYIKWRSASLLAASVGKSFPEWEKTENQWRNQMLQMIDKRNRSPIFIREFSGG